MQPIRQYYYQQSRTEMLAFIPPSVTCTLEVGCGAGSFSVLIKDKLDGVSNISLLVRQV